MKIAFDKLKNKVKKILIFIHFVLALSLLVFAYLIENVYIKLSLGIGCLLVLVVLFFMLVWYVMYIEKFNGKNKYLNVDEDKVTELIVEYSKVMDDHYLKSVFVENLTLAENLDKLSLGEDNLHYIDDVDNKYDKEALALFYKEFKIGYFYKNGKFRETLRTYINNKDYKVITTVCGLDLLNNKVRVKVAFYKSIESSYIEYLDVNVDANVDYIKQGYWLNVTKFVNIVNKTQFRIDDIYGKEITVIDLTQLNDYEGELFAKVLSNNNGLNLRIYKF